MSDDREAVHLVVVTGKHDTTKDIFTDIAEWLKEMEPHEYNDTMSCVDGCILGDSMYLAGHRVRKTGFTKNYLPIFEPIEH